MSKLAPYYRGLKDTISAKKASEWKPFLVLFAIDLSEENISIIEIVIAHKQIANVHNRRIVFLGGLSAHSNEVGIACEFLPTSNHRQADRTNSEVVYHRVRANHEAQ